MLGSAIMVLGLYKIMEKKKNVTDRVLLFV